MEERERAVQRPRFEAPRWSLAALAHGARTAHENARLEATELALALAAQAVALAEDADSSELPDRFATLERTIWPEAPLEGFRLASSLGALLVARVAISWAPPTGPQTRAVSHDADGVRRALSEQGLPPLIAENIVGTWREVDPDFEPMPQGLDVARLAALAEGTLTRRERGQALSQVAQSPRCLARLVTIAQALVRVRAVLPVLPPPSLDLGASYVPAVAALVLGRPDRALELVGARPERLPLITLAELAKARWALSRGEPAELPSDSNVVVPAIEAGDLAVTALPAPARGEPALETDEDDVLSIVEESVPNGAAPIEVAAERRAPRVPTWELAEHEHFDEEFLLHWQGARRASSSTLGRVGRVLDLSALSPAATLPLIAVPPDPRHLRALIEEAGLAANEATSNLAPTTQVDLRMLGKDHNGRSVLGSTEPMFAAARGALRAIEAAAEGNPPSSEAVSRSGDLDWVVRRARILGLAAHGAVDQAISAAGQPAVDTPELRFALLRAMRFRSRPAPRADAAEVRMVAAELVSDLTLALARSVAGTLG